MKKSLNGPKNKNIKWNNRFSAVSMILVLLFAVVGIFVFLKFYNAYIDKTLYEERLSQMREVTTQLFSGLEDVVGNQWKKTANSCRELLNEDPQNMDEFMDFMEEQAYLEDFDSQQMDYAAVDQNGKYYTKAGEQGLLSERSYLASGLEQISFVSNSMTYDDSRMFFLKKLSEPITFEKSGKKVSIIYFGISQNMEELNPYFKCSAYNGNNSVYVVDEDGLRLFSNSNEENMLKGYNVYNTLKGLKYLHGSSFEDTKRTLDEKGLAYSNAVLDGEEVYYALNKMKNAAWTLVFLVPSSYVAVNTVRLIHTTICFVLVFAAALVAVCITAIFLLMRNQQKMALAVEKKNNEILGKMNAELREAAKKAEHASQVAEEASKAKTEFLANMSHDIRTPMNALLGYNQLLKNVLLKNERTDPKLLHYQRKMEQSGNLLLSIINNVLDMSRIESGKMELDENYAVVRDILEEIMGVFASTAKKKEIQITCEQQVQHQHIMCDITKVKQIFVNLVSNAVKYTPSGGTITLRSQELPCDQEGFVLIKSEIMDNGIGMSKDYLPKLFEAFTRERNTTIGKVTGTGLGMSIVKELVEMMGGSIEVESELGKGTKFTVTLRHRIADEKYYDQKAGAVGSAHKETFEGRHILLAEDNELNAEIAVTILKEMGLEVDRVEDGIQCVSRMEQMPAGSYDLILMDIQMPGMDGYKATEAIRRLADKKKANIPIVAMTANAFEEDKKMAFSKGMNGHIAKPIDVEKMEETLASVLENKEIILEKRTSGYEST